MPKNMVPEVQRGLIAFDGPGMSLVDGLAIPSPVQKRVSDSAGSSLWGRVLAAPRRLREPQACSFSLSAGSDLRA